MKVHITQLDAVTSNTLALALEYYAAYIAQVDDRCSDKYTSMAARIRHAEVLLAEYQYNAPIDDVEVLGTRREEDKL